MSVVDITDDQDERMKHLWQFTLWPRQWQSYQSEPPYQWEMYKLIESERQNIPDSAGVYTIIVQPQVFTHPACMYLMYAGKSRSLRRRFGEYLNERSRRTGRPKLLRVLNKYPDHTWFCFSVVPEARISSVEDALLSAYIPPCNDRFPAPISRIGDAF